MGRRAPHLIGLGATRHFHHALLARFSHCCRRSPVCLVWLGLAARTARPEPAPLPLVETPRRRSRTVRSAETEARPRQQHSPGSQSARSPGVAAGGRTRWELRAQPHPCLHHTGTNPAGESRESDGWDLVPIRWRNQSIMKNGLERPVAEDALGFLDVVALVTHEVLKLNDEALIAECFGLFGATDVALHRLAFRAEHFLQHFSVRRR